MNINSKIYIAGHTGMVGSSLVRKFRSEGFNNLITITEEELDLCNSEAVDSFFKKEQPDYVILAAAKVGGIEANRKNPLGFLRINLMIQDNVFASAFKCKVKKIMFLGSSCIYPKECPQPIKEEYFMTGPLEPTNEGYALAKIVGFKTAQYYFEQHGLISVCPMPCNLYGTNDSFDPIHSHVLSALVRKFSDAVEENLSEITMWGSGIARREFLHVNDLARAAFLLLNKMETPEIINVGSGKDISIKELAELIAKKTGFTGKILWDTTKPDGMLRKCLEVSKIKKLGFEPEISLSEGIDGVMKEYKIFKNKN